MNWIEVAVRGVDGEAAEALSEVMNRFGQGGAVIEQEVNSPTSTDALPQPLSVKVYVAEGADAARTVRRLREAIWHLNVIYPLPEPEVRTLAQVDWAEAWKQHYARSKPGERLVIVPAWEEEALEPDELPIRIDPGMAFGTGTHPSTRFCLVLLERHLRPGDRVFDVGTGSGILSVAAVRLGAGQVVASDVDPIAVAATRENAALNAVADAIATREGSVDAWEGPFDLLLMNILAEVIVQLLPAAAARLAADGRMILAGIIAEREGAVREQLAALGLEVIERLEESDWVGLAVARPHRAS